MRKKLSEEQILVNQIVTHPLPYVGGWVGNMEQVNPELATKVLPLLIDHLVRMFESLDKDYNDLEKEARLKCLKSANEDFAEKVWEEYRARYIYRVAVKYWTPEETYDTLCKTDRGVGIRVMEMLMKGGIS